MQTLRPYDRHASRRGIATIWIVLAGPTILALFILLSDIANLWVARVELENALEAAALAAVKEWGDASGGDTMVPRQIGADFAFANNVVGTPVDLQGIDPALNYDPVSGGPNQNASCDGVLVFGSIIPAATPLEPPFTFNAGLRPGCGAGQVLLDVSQQGSGVPDANNSWGVSFQVTEDPTPAGLRIDKIVIDLQAGGGTGQFDLTPADSPALSDNSPGQFAVHDKSGNEQPDIFGFTDPANQILFSPTTGFSSTLTINFVADPIGGDLGFEPGDRFRFGVVMDGVSSGGGSDDGDGVGRDGVQATIFFNNGQTVTVTFFDNNTEGSNDCIDPALIDPVTGTLVVHPSMIPDLPCPPSSANNNNGQSFATTFGAGNRPFGVRAQATIQVKSLWTQICGIPLGPYNISAKTDAVYDCQERTPRLIKITEFICPGP